MKYLLLLLLVLSGCTVTGNTWQRCDTTGEMVLVEKMELRGFGAREYTIGKTIKKDEPTAIPDLVPTDLIGDILEKD